MSERKKNPWQALFEKAKSIDPVMSEESKKEVIEFTANVPEVNGVPCRVVSPDEAEKSDYVVCAPAEGNRYFDDDVLTVCAKCERPIRHRPHAPKKPPKICIICAADLPMEE